MCTSNCAAPKRAVTVRASIVMVETSASMVMVETKASTVGVEA